MILTEMSTIVLLLVLFGRFWAFLGVFCVQGYYIPLYGGGIPPENFQAMGNSLSENDRKSL
jgi:hypothetical protein